MIVWECKFLKIWSKLYSVIFWFCSLLLLLILVPLFFHINLFFVDRVSCCIRGSSGTPYTLCWPQLRDRSASVLQWFPPGFEQKGNNLLFGYLTKNSIWYFHKVGYFNHGWNECAHVGACLRTHRTYCMHITVAFPAFTFILISNLVSF